MRFFLSPEEQSLLERLPANEAQVLRDLFDELDAHLVEEDPAFWMRQSRLPTEEAA